jgi:large subunit ribosomal protein L21
MYAIIRSGGKQAKVEEGDVLDVERIKGDGAVTFTPLLVVADDGSVISDRATLETVTVSAEVVGAAAGPKIDTFKYKNKTGYRRRMGHRQKYTRIQVTTIEVPGQEKAAKAPAAEEPVVADEPIEKNEADATEAAVSAADTVADEAAVDAAAGADEEA